MICAVVHLIHVQTPHRHVAKLFIKGVPKGTSAGELKALLTENGYEFGEFGIPWANHYIQMGIKDAHPEVKGAWKRGGVETIHWKDLQTDWEAIDEEE